MGGGRGRSRFVRAARRRRRRRRRREAAAFRCPGLLTTLARDGGPPRRYRALRAALRDAGAPARRPGCARRRAARAAPRGRWNEVCHAEIGRKLAAAALTADMPRTNPSHREPSLAARGGRAADQRGGNAPPPGRRCSPRRRAAPAAISTRPPRPYSARGRSMRDPVRRRAAGRPGGLAGRPFVGPAGQCSTAPRRGRRRPRRRPTSPMRSSISSSSRAASAGSIPSRDASEIEACRWWLEQERELVRPAVTVALGATAARSIFGKVVTISRMRGEAHELPEARAARPG